MIRVDAKTVAVVVNGTRVLLHHPTPDHRTEAKS